MVGGPLLKKKKKKAKRAKKIKRKAESDSGSVVLDNRSKVQTATNSTGDEQTSESTPTQPQPEVSQPQSDATQPQHDTAGSQPNYLQLQNVESSTSTVQQTDKEFSSQKLTLQGSPPAPPAQTPATTEQAPSGRRSPQSSPPPPGKIVLPIFSLLFMPIHIELFAKYT